MDDGRTTDTRTTNESWRAPMPSLAHRVRMVVAVEVVPLALAAWGVASVGVSTLGIALFVAMYILTMTGIELGMHRLIAHRQFTGPSWLRAALCVLGAMAGEGSPLLWSAIHRLHHRDPDGVDDVHSPTHARSGLLAKLRGIVWAQCGWYGEVPGITRFRHVLGGRREDSVADAQAQRLVDVVQDWRADRVVLAVDLLYPVWIVAGFVVPTVIGLIVGGGLDGALTGLVWGGVVRFVAVQKVSFAINSVGHTIGSKYLKTNDDSRNNVVMAVLTLGSGWHNNHHAFPGSASLWFAPWHVDPCWLIIRGLERLGVAHDVRRVGPQIVEARRAR
jgi:stearoyl-CoA desaturase (Delta-9 desaturase)